MDAAILEMACSVCGGHTLAWKGDVDEARFFSGSNKSSQYFLLTKKLNCSVQIISWATAENMALSTMLCQSSDGWSGLDGANLTCYSESAINSTVMEVKNCTPISYLPPSMGESLKIISSVKALYHIHSFTAVNTNTSSDITHIVVVAVVVVASFCAIVLLAIIIVSLAIKRCCTAAVDPNTTTAELINYSDVVAEVSSVVTVASAYGHMAFHVSMHTFTTSGWCEANLNVYKQCYMHGCKQHDSEAKFPHLCKFAHEVLAVLMKTQHQRVRFPSPQTFSNLKGKLLLS